MSVTSGDLRWGARVLVVERGWISQTVCTPEQQHGHALQDYIGIAFKRLWWCLLPTTRSCWVGGGACECV